MCVDSLRTQMEIKQMILKVDEIPHEVEELPIKKNRLNIPVFFLANQKRTGR